MALREAIAHPSGALVLAPLASGIVQSMVRAASSEVGRRGTSTATILIMTGLVGSVWGLVQLLAVSGLLYLVARDANGQRIPFRRLRTVVAVAYTPLGAAFVGWLVATLLLGPGLYINPESLASIYGPITALEVSLLYFATGVCLLWSFALQVLAVAEARGSSVLSALGTVLSAALLAGILILLLVVVAVLLIH
jgi:hypothetical protein